MNGELPHLILDALYDALSPPTSAADPAPTGRDLDDPTA